MGMEVVLPVSVNIEVFKCMPKSSTSAMPVSNTDVRFPVNSKLLPDQKQSPFTQTRTANYSLGTRTSLLPRRFQHIVAELSLENVLFQKIPRKISWVTKMKNISVFH